MLENASETKVQDVETEKEPPGCEHYARSCQLLVSIFVFTSIIFKANKEPDNNLSTHENGWHSCINLKRCGFIISFYRLSCKFAKFMIKDISQNVSKYVHGALLCMLMTL